MKPLRHTLFVLLMSLPSLAVAQTTTHTHEPSTQAVSADTLRAFEKLKTLAGSWAGQLTTTPGVPAVDGKFAQFSMQVASRGNAMVHEMAIAGLPDHPVTMFYLEGDRLALTHYCDAGNRPRMIGKLSPDGKTLEFDFLDLAGGNEQGHMHRAVFTFIDENHHTEDWTFMTPGDRPMRAHFDLQRTNFESSSAR
jgi:hypothetical protein